MGLIIPEKRRMGMLDDAPEEVFGGDRETRDGHGPFVPNGAQEETRHSRGILLEVEAAHEESGPPAAPEWQPMFPQRPADDKETVRVSPVERTPADLEPIDLDAPEDELGEEEEETEESKQERRRDELLAEVPMPEDPFGTGAPRDLWVRNRVMAAGGKPFSDALEVVIDGIPTAISIIVDFTPVVGDLKGIAEAIRGRDLITDQELGWGCRLLSLMCLSELRTIGKGGKSTRGVRKIEANIPVDRLAASGADKNVREGLGKALTKSPEVSQGIQEEIKRMRREQAWAHGKHAENALDEPIDQTARNRHGIHKRQVTVVKDGVLVARFDAVVILKKFRLIYEIKGIRWKMPSYSTRSGVSSLLSKTGAQVRRHGGAKKAEDIYELIFYEIPAFDWQKEMILKWADDLGIIVSFERPRGL